MQIIQSTALLKGFRLPAEDETRERHLSCPTSSLPPGEACGVQTKIICCCTWIPSGYLSPSGGLHGLRILMLTVLTIIFSVTSFHPGRCAYLERRVFSQGDPLGHDADGPRLRLLSPRHRPLQRYSMNIELLTDLPSWLLRSSRHIKLLKS